MQQDVDIWMEKWNTIPASEFTETLQEKAVRAFNETLLKVQSICFKKKYRKVSKYGRNQDDDLNLNILRLRARISKHAWQIKKRNGINIEARQKLLEANKKLKTLI